MRIPPGNAELIPKAFGASLQGQRADQQDAFRTRWLKIEQALLLVVADGMGGHVAGGLASRIAVDSFVAEFVASRRKGMRLDDALNRALNDANARIGKAQETRPEVAGMGTTLAAAYVSPPGLAWISVGDSPIWLYRSGTLSRLNEDHSFRQAAGAETSSAANMLQSALTGQPISMVDCHSVPTELCYGDFILIGSDGVLTLSERTIAQIINENTTKGPQVITQALLEAVEQRQKPNQDNCTVLIASPPKKQSPTFALQTRHW